VAERDPWKMSLVAAVTIVRSVKGVEDGKERERRMHQLRVSHSLGIAASGITAF